MMRRLLVGVAACAMLLGGRALRAQEFIVVVNASNPVTALPKDQVSKLFLKKLVHWDNGQQVAPVDLPEGSPLRDAFCRAVHGKSVLAVKAYWQQQIFSGRDVPPPEKTSDADVLAYVRANRNAIGYVSTKAELGSGVKAVTVQ